jgi:hypothetical protein
MDTLLVTIAVLALAMAAAMGFVVIRLLREERLRSDARVAALAEADTDDIGMAAPTERRIAVASPGAAPASRVPDLALRPTSEIAGLFAEPERSSPWAQRLAIAGALAMVVTAAGYAVLSRDGRAPGAASPSSAVATQAAPLELLSLSHAQQGESLTITGLVQNPRASPAQSGISATAFLFGADGSFLASGRAPLDYSTLAPGDESPFVITVPVTGAVARYRVGFRGQDGNVLGHVDRRSTGALAAR